MTTAAGHVAGHSAEKDKEKVEKRRALGRGLESLLPGPRVVPPGAPGQSGGAAGRPQVPPFVRNDKAISNEHPAVPAQSAGEPFSGTIRAVAEDFVDGDARAPHIPSSHEAELRSGGQPLQLRSGQAGAAVPTFDGAAPGAEPITIYAQAESRIPGNLVANIAIADIDKNPFQTRYVDDDEALAELAESIKANGVVQPILVRPSEEGEGRYILILGERRLHASKKAGKTHIPAMVRKVSLQQAAEMTIVENLQREDLSPLEQAEAFKVLSTQFNLTQEEIGKRVGLSRVSIANYMRLLKLPREVMELLAQKSLTFAEAKELLSLENADQIAHAAIYAVKKGMTAEQIERMVLSMNGLAEPFPGMPGQEKKASGARWVDPNVRSAQLELERMLGVRVKIRDRKGKGKIVIEYSTVDDYERVVGMLKGSK